MILLIALDNNLLWIRKIITTNDNFSEDLDFTAIKPDFILDLNLLNEITSLINQRTDIQLHIETLTLLRHKDMPTGFSAIVKFWGADHPKNQMPPAPDRWHTSIKIEIINYEKLIFAPENKKVIHQYSDSLSPNAKDIPCYSLTEVMSEKMRALIQRSYTAPRDYFDIWYLSNNISDFDWTLITDAFHQKMKFINLEFTGVDQLVNDDNVKKLKAAWNNSLGHQIPNANLPEFEEVNSYLKELFMKVFY